MDYQSNITSLQYFIPELILAGSILLVIIADLILSKRDSWRSAYYAFAGVVATFIAVIVMDNSPRGLFFDTVAVDPFGTFFKVLILIATVFTIGISMRTKELERYRFGEYYGLILTMVLGMFLLVSAVDLLMIYLSLEMVSIPSYILAGYLKNRQRSNEASLKYVIYGGVASGIMLYGFSILFGLTGSTNLTVVHQALLGGNVSTVTLTVTILLILTGFGFKIASVPFHFWSPDVYEGAPTPITGFLSVAPKAAGFAILIRFFNVVFVGNTTPNMTEWFVMSSLPWPEILAAISAMTMFLGNLVAIKQENIKRMLAYSSIAHAGYILMGAVVLTQQGVFAMLYYLFVYLFMNLGAFLIVIIISNNYDTETIDDYRGLGFKIPYIGVVMAVFMFALTGLPPTAGFIGKFYLFSALIEAGQEFYWLAVVGIINSVISFYYYARVVKVMFFEDAPDSLETVKPRAWMTTLVTLLVIPTIILGLYWNSIAEFTLKSLQFF
ncbi:MAG: NADH-quinone oxidoreductase subunit N [Candidatus Marinimicrobia bacterium]|nr:NADH-quinone oxidoreductase subunit N [Candidatus Neomarinimicrobiota bacterium]MCF7829007.1 NADH-quinone oxidoreductase subunit N [Candidatus Neomarinimicrobiota bacterium]MCF7879967.1 NADH-quinone oxidoreductase subunit N [Candidatus Neomarinimicrobiota bacterium]